MKKTFTLILIQLSFLVQISAQYNKMSIPAIMNGTYDSVLTHRMTYSLVLRDTLQQFLPGNQTITSCFNRSGFLGPTLIMHNGQDVQMNVINLLNDSTTVHWHGIHLPPVMDGGPHQIIPQGTSWLPYWKVDDKAATYWYHPHLHKETEAQVNQGLAGLLIVKDAEEDALLLPRNYGVNDIPLVVTDRRFDSNNQFVLNFVGDTVLTNGTLNAEYNVPAQVVRFRMLCATIERNYNVGLKNNDTFYVITSDGGLLNAPVPVTRYLISPGQRIEFLINFTGKNGSHTDLMAYNTELDTTQVGGLPPFPVTDTTVIPHVTYLARYDSLEQRNFKLLHINVTDTIAVTPPVHIIPATLTTNHFWDTSTVNRHIHMLLTDTCVNPPTHGFFIDSFQFSMDTINKVIALNDTVIWTIRNNTSVNHDFHIHDIQFHILSRHRVDSAQIPRHLIPAEDGWKDDVMVNAGEILSFIAVFNDYADSIKPFMYHCHMLGHEDGGMMGQFLVKKSKDVTYVKNINILPDDAVKIYPNPASDRLFVELEDKNSSVYYITVFDAVGRSKYMLPSPQLHDGINIADLKPGNYFVHIIDAKGAQITKKFIKL